MRFTSHRGLLADELLSTSGLKLNTTGYYHGYNSSLDSSVSNNFAAASFRFGHTLLPGLIKMLGSSSDEVEYVQLHRMLFDPFRLYRSGELARSLRGAMNTSVEASDPYFTSEVGVFVIILLLHLVTMITKCGTI